MWDILPGITFASDELLKFDLHPAYRLSLARRFGLLDWIDTPIRILLAAPLGRYTEDSKDRLDFELYTIIATAKESIATARKLIGNHPPFPNNFDNGPFCEQHPACKRIWFEKWFFVILRRIHHASEPLPLIMIPQALEEMDHRGINPECKRFIITWIQESCMQLIHREEHLIQETIATVRSLFT
jgi:hypothetical protein